jgi:hypothetical protein
MEIDHDASYEPPHASSPFPRILDTLQVHGYRPHQDEPDPRPLPVERAIQGALADIFDALVVTLNDARLEPDLDDPLWAQVNLYRRAASRVARELDANEDAQKQAQTEQDASRTGSTPRAAS